MSRHLFIIAAIAALTGSVNSINLDLLDMNRSGDLVIAKCQHKCIDEVNLNLSIR